ncbi:copper transporter [Brachybacterium sp. GPGPB12]|uniref:copper transporter n=1 Tax=Brachybacterium sp. GPGPB12 TaxID=3023517 RepID=UPI00313440D8
MIDFRYHLVSLISVFLALAVGIVLGAGPLRENLGDQLAGQVERLRTEQERLRTEAERLAGENDQLSSFITEVGPELVDGTLEGRGSRSSPTTTPPAPPPSGSPRCWTRPASSRPCTSSRRARCGSRDASRRGPTRSPRRSRSRPRRSRPSEEEELTDSERLSALIPGPLAGGEGDPLDEESRGQMWQVLIEHGMVSVDGGAPGTVDGVVHASAAPEELAVDTDDDQAAAERAQGPLASRTSMLTALAGTGLPAVVSAVTPANDASTGILRTVRGEATYDALSTTDRSQEPDGPVLSVLALVEQTRGASGAYGTTADAAERLPALPETAQVGTEGDGSGGVGTEGGAAPSDGGGAE